MKVGDTHYRSVWVNDDGWSVSVIDQTQLPHDFRTARLTTAEEAATAIRTMLVRGAPCIGATGAFGLCLAVREDPSDAAVAHAAASLLVTRPTAIDLRYNLEAMLGALRGVEPERRAATAYATAARLADESVAACAAIGRHGLSLIHEVAARKAGVRVNILTHCNAGWLACVDHGTALAPIYAAHDAGIPVHVWVDETRPRNQGAALTAWELGRHGVPHTVIVDNLGGHLMQRGAVDLCIVGSDRTTANGDVANKIGTYLKALAAKDNGVPFYVALPESTLDWTLSSGADIPIEERDPVEVRTITGVDGDGRPTRVRLTPDGSPALNYAFDVTPAHLVTALITERGACAASAAGLRGLYPERA